MLAARDSLVDDFLAQNCREILCPVALQSGPYMSAEEGDIGKLEMTKFLALLSARSWTRMVTARFRSWAGFDAFHCIMKSLRVAFIDTGMPTAKP